MRNTLFDEELLSLSQAAKSLPSRPHPSTVWRWTKRGVRGVRLETIVIASRRFTSREALERFVAATTAVVDGDTTAQHSARFTPRVREALDANGL